MKIYCSIIFVLFFNSLNAQLPGFPLLDETSTWQAEGVSAIPNGFHCNQGVEVDITFRTYYLSGDTTISGNTYFNMFAYDIDSSYCIADPNIYWLDTVTNFVRHIREENNKIYTYNEITQSESILWDYDLINIGTTINSSCVIGSIDTLYLLEQPYLKYNCDCDEDYIIQGIGNSQTFFSPPNCGTGFGGNWKNLCYQKNGFHIEVDSMAECFSLGDTSLYVATINPINQLNNKIFPNPTNDFINVKLFYPMNGSYAVFSLDGKELLSQQFNHVEQLSIDLSLFSKGIYFLNLQNSEGKVYFEKIVKMSD